ncbi:hypothetical protein ACHAPF_009390 [Botrytis cinerea]
MALLSGKLGLSLAKVVLIGREGNTGLRKSWNFTILLYRAPILLINEKGIVQMERLPLPPATFLLFAGQVLPYISSSENQGA